MKFLGEEQNLTIVQIKLFEDIPILKGKIGQRPGERCCGIEAGNGKFPILIS